MMYGQRRRGTLPIIPAQNKEDVVFIFFEYGRIIAHR